MNNISSSKAARIALELAFKFSNYPSHVDKQRLAQSCNMTHRQIEIWVYKSSTLDVTLLTKLQFQNRRDRGAKQQSGVLSQVDSLEKLREALHNMLLLARPKQKRVAHDSIDMWRFQILPDTASNSVPTPSISASSIDSDMEEPIPPIFENCRTPVSKRTVLELSSGHQNK